MEYEFDREKSEGNKQKHGIDFYEAPGLWDDPDFIEIPVKASDEPIGVPRQSIIKVWVAERLEKTS
jgi:uncharacterized DUF497 family protein